MKISNIKFYVLAGFLALTACEGEEDPFNTDGSGFESQLAQLYVDAEALATNIYNRVDVALRDSVLNATDSAMIDGAKVTRSGSTVTIDFGNGVTGSDGKVRKGNISITETGSYMVANGSATAVLNNFSVDDEPVAGSVTAANQGNDSILITVNNLNYNNEFTFQSTKTVVWESGFNTPNDDSDDRYNLNGNGSGTETVASNMVVANISNNLVFDRICEHGVTEGKIDLTLSGDSVKYDNVGVDFIAGDGANSDGCDNLMRITVNQNGTEITVTRQFSGF